MKVSDQLRAIAIYNLHEILLHFGEEEKDDVGLSYYIPQSRGVMSKRSVVYSPSHHTAPGTAWYNNNQKTFIGKRSKSKPEAQAWVLKRYGIKEWKPCPFSPHNECIPKTVWARMNAALKAAGE